MKDLIRNRYHACKINRLEAIGLLAIAGMSAVEADLFLRCISKGI